MRIRKSNTEVVDSEVLLLQNVHKLPVLLQGQIFIGACNSLIDHYVDLTTHGNNQCCGSGSTQVK